MLYAIIRTFILPFFRRSLASVEGTERIPKNGSYILAANHVDYLDGFFVTAAIHTSGRKHKVKFLSETKNYWWTGGATIPIDWTDKAGSVLKAADVVRAGGVVCIFPEGQRNPTDTLRKGKTGVARLALFTGCPVIPVGLRGPSHVSFGASVRAMLRGQNRVELRFGAPMVYNGGMTGDIAKDLLDQTTQSIMASLAPLCRKTIDHTL